jgi:hypothetical protein
MTSIYLLLCHGPCHATWISNIYPLFARACFSVVLGIYLRFAHSSSSHQSICSALTICQLHFIITCPCFPSTSTSKPVFISSLRYRFIRDQNLYTSPMFFVSVSIALQFVFSLLVMHCTQFPAPCILCLYLPSQMQVICVISSHQRDVFES